MRWQDREGQAARTEIALDLLFQSFFRIGIALIISMAVDCPRTTAGTYRTNYSELIFSKLDRRRSPKSLRPIKPLYRGHHDSTPLNLCLTGQSHAPPSIHSATSFSQSPDELKAECDSTIGNLKTMTDTLKKEGLDGGLEVRLFREKPSARYYMFDRSDARGLTFFIPHIHGLNSPNVPGLLLSNVPGGLFSIFSKGADKLWDESHPFQN
jgi:hypothetical protein